MRGIYIHIPFCAKKCRYCDFASYEGMLGLSGEYIKALGEEMRLYRGEAADTVFIGGGTPTMLSAGEISRLLELTAANFRLSSDPEITSEANPGTLDDEKLRALYTGGANRLSIGVQSFDNGELKALGRIHDADTAVREITAAQRYFDNINVDLMTAIPRQTEKTLLKSLETAASLGVKHISCYSLIIEEGTPLYDDFKAGAVRLPEEEEDRKMYEMTRDFLRSYGYERYEISNYALSGFECRHNLKYWDCGEYIGIGAAAHSYFEGARYSNTRDVREYIRGGGRGLERTVLTADDKMGEFMILGLRRTDGISETEFFRRFGKSFEAEYGAVAGKYISGGFMERKDGRVFLTDKGTDVSNYIMCDFLK